jgi:2-amino-4-hydroxy-6-hydroxymethyldihydropteridine diphosphokinase
MPGAASWDAVIGLGSNMGDKAANIARAIELLCAEGDVREVARSRCYRTAPWGKTDQDWFVNACVSVTTALDPHALLDRCQRVEDEMGRVRRERWGPRVIDVDILLYRDARIADGRLTLPHPLIPERAFVLVPLLDVAPDALVAGARARDLLARMEPHDVAPHGQAAP